jgi:hypothetical protein
MLLFRHARRGESIALIDDANTGGQAQARGGSAIVCVVPEFFRRMSIHTKEYETMAKKPKFTPAQIKNHVKKIQEVIEQQKGENQGEHFRSLTREEIENKLKRVIPIR